MEMFNRKLRRYMKMLSAVLLLVLFSTGSVFAASVSETEESSAFAESSSVEDSSAGSSTEGEHSVESSAPENRAAESSTPAGGKETEESDTEGVSDGIITDNNDTQALEALKTIALKTTKDSYTYTGASITPAVKLVYTDPSAKEAEEVDVTEHFILEDPVYEGDTVNVGTAKVSVVISGYYETDDAGQKTPVYFGDDVSGVKKEASYTISARSIKKAEITLKTTSYTYNGKARKPAVTSVKLGDVTLKKDTDYTVSYKNNTNAGTATVKVTGKGNYSSSASVTFKIKKAKFSDVAALTLSKTSYTYNGKTQKPGVTVKMGDKTLKKDTDYTVSYSKDCKNAGKKTVKVTAAGDNFTDKDNSLSVKYTIKAKSISSASVTLTNTKYAYSGKNKKPGATVKIKLSSGTVTLKKDTDYTLTHSKNCKSIGPKTVTIKGTGNYSGSIKKTYKVIPEKATSVKISKRTTSSLTATCKTARDTSCKYHFMLKQYNSKTEKWEEVESKYSKTNSARFTGLTAGRAYRVYVRIYKKVDSKSYIGSWSSALKTATTPAKPVISSAVKTGEKKMKVTWKAVAAATGYEIQYSTSSDFSSNTKTVKVKGRTTTSTSISLGTTKNYYVRVRAYKTYNDVTYRGSWSSKLSTSMSNVYASYSTTYNSSNTNRSTNLRLACNAINGTVLSNGETFSFNGIVGERTAAKGYKEAIIYEGGQEVGGIGGGICQVATTIFNAALKANFQIVERYQHSLTVHYVPLGYDAAIAWGSKNLRFKNNSGTSIKVQASASGGTLSIKFLTSTGKKPPAVTTKVTVRNGVYTLKRYVNGECNYTTTSDYLDN